MDVKFRKDALGMVPSRMHADSQPIGDFAIGALIGQQDGDPRFLPCEAEPAGERVLGDGWSMGPERLTAQDHHCADILRGEVRSRDDYRDDDAMVA